MKKNNKKIYAVIAIVVVAVMVLVPILSIITSVITSSNREAQIESREEIANLEDEITDETTLEIIDINQNLDDYVDKEISMELEYFQLNDSKDKFSLGTIDTFNGEKMIFNILAETEDSKIPEGYEDFDKVKVDGTIKESVEIKTEDNNSVPIMIVKNIEKIDIEKEGS